MAYRSVGQGVRQEGPEDGGGTCYFHWLQIKQECRHDALTAVGLVVLHNFHHPN